MPTKDTKTKMATRATTSEEKKPQLSSSSSSLRTVAIVGLPCLLAWIVQGTVIASDDLWIPLPLIGYLRWDIFLVTFLFIELPIFSGCLQNKHWIYRAVLILALALPFIPNSVRPIYYTKPIDLFFEYYEEMMGFPYAAVDDIAVNAHATGLSANVSQQLVHLAWDQRHEWTHVTSSMCLGYFQYGPSLNFDKMYYRQPSSIWSFSYGVVALSRRPARMSKESHFRLKYPEKRAQVVRVLEEHMLPQLRPAYARTLNIPTEQVFFGDETFGELGIPAITIMLPNAAWNSISNIHTDSMYAGKFQEKNEQKPFCNSTYDVTTFLLPLTAAEGSGLRYWREKDQMEEVYYEIGNVYTFNATTIHAIRPLPYREWRRQEVRMTVQAFGVECDDGRWVIYH